jgi:hypothetical protein
MWLPLSNGSETGHLPDEPIEACLGYGAALDEKFEVMEASLDQEEG